MWKNRSLTARITLLVTAVFASAMMTIYTFGFTPLTALELLALFTLLMTFYLHSLLKPLRQLSTTIDAVEPGSPLQLPIDARTDEIGRINHALSQMYHRLSAHETLRHDRETELESRIAQQNEALQRLLYTDNLTGLPNRMKLIEDLAGHTDAVLAIVNIDAFRQINDFYGQQAGDHIIKMAGHALTLLTEHCLLMKTYRLGGDEFALFCPRPIASEPLEAFLTEVTQYFSDNPVAFKDIDIDVHVTMGVTLKTDKAIEKADIALKNARKRGLSYVVYDESLNVEGRYEANMQWLRRLKYAIANDNIIPYYQPIFDNQDHRVVSYECLMRLRENDGTIIAPLNFLPVAKRARLYTRLTQIMVKKCCEHFREKEAMFSINLSAEDIRDDATKEMIRHTVEFTGVGERIIFEILESEGIENYEEVSRFIDEMKQIGCRFAIDDFGAGYSNFEHLLRLSIDFIKIDGSLIHNLDSNENASEIVETIIEFAHKRSLISIAEFVHCDPVFDAVKRLGIDRSQGFYLGEPKPETL